MTKFEKYGKVIEKIEEKEENKKKYYLNSTEIAEDEYVEKIELHFGKFVMLVKVNKMY